MINRLIVSLVLINVFCGCVTKKIAKNHEKTKQETIKIVRDSVVITRISEPIKDTIFIGLKTDNKVIDSIVNARLKNLKTYRSSGTNNVRIVYDTIYKAVKIITNVQGSQDKNTQINNSTDLQSEEKEIDKEKVTKTKQPNWFIILGIIFFSSVAFGFFRIVKRFT